MAQVVQESQDSDDDIPQLSSETFAALQEFYKEQENREEKLKNILNSTQKNDNLTFDENWVNLLITKIVNVFFPCIFLQQLSQFWYNLNTTETLVDVAIKLITTSGKIALISCPTLYPKMKEAMAKGEGIKTINKCINYLQVHINSLIL